VARNHPVVRPNLVLCLILLRLIVILASLNDTTFSFPPVPYVTMAFISARDHPQARARISPTAVAKSLPERKSVGVVVPILGQNTPMTSKVGLSSSSPMGSFFLSPSLTLRRIARFNFLLLTLINVMFDQRASSQATP